MKYAAHKCSLPFEKLPLRQSLAAIYWQFTFIFKISLSLHSQPENVSEEERCDAQLNIPLCGMCSSQSLTAKANAPLMFRSR